MDRITNYREWEKGVPADFTTDPLWQVEVYRLALFLADIGWRDVTKLAQDKRTGSLSDQLYRAIGSAHEGRDWYYKARFILTEEIMQHRIALLSQISRLLITMISQKRNSSTLHESTEPYNINPQNNENHVDPLLNTVPLP